MDRIHVDHNMFGMIWIELALNPIASVNAHKVCPAIHHTLLNLLTAVDFSIMDTLEQEKCP